VTYDGGGVPAAIGSRRRKPGLPIDLPRWVVSAPKDGGLDQGLDLAGRQVLLGPKLRVRTPDRSNCSIYFGWRDQFEMRFAMRNRPRGMTTVRSLCKARVSQTAAPGGPPACAKEHVTNRHTSRGPAAHRSECMQHRQGLCRADRAQGGRLRRPFSPRRLPDQRSPPRRFRVQDAGRVAAQDHGRAAGLCARR
jgi:hypothetical protein